MADPALTRMVIEAFENRYLTGSPVTTYSVKVNPERYSKSFEVLYDTRGGMGEMNALLKFSRMPPSTMQFELLFDATGAIDGSPTDLTAEIKDFVNTIYAFQGDIHQPYYLKVTWGTESFGARATSLGIDYVLFSNTGAPLRARATLGLMNYMDAETIEKLSAKESPDMTHRILVRAGETLPEIAARVYGDPGWYPELARANGLVDFRALRPGTEIHCPPLAGDREP